MPGLNDNRKFVLGPLRHHVAHQPIQNSHEADAVLTDAMHLGRTLVQKMNLIILVAQRKGEALREVSCAELAELHQERTALGF